MGRINRYSWKSYSNNYTYPYNSQTLFFRPKLHIEFDQEHDPNTFAPASNPRKFLKIRVRNSGKSTAHDCEATVKIIIPPNVESNKFPSDDAKKLVWGLKPDLSDLKESINIKKILQKCYMLYLQILYFHLFHFKKVQDMLHFQQWINSQREV